jgi:DNA-binding MarR family transcriptional regulator
LSEGRLAALLAVSDEPGITPARLAERLGVTRATVTGLTDGLVKASLIERAADEGDRRSMLLHLTALGDALIVRLAPLYATWLTEVTAGVPVSSHKALIGAFMAIQRNLTFGITAGTNGGVSA